MELPHIGEWPASEYFFRNSSAAASTAASSVVDALTLSISPERPWVFWFHSSMAASVASDWCTTQAGDSATISSSELVTTMAISMMRSPSGFKPVISMSSQTRLFALPAI